MNQRTPTVGRGSDKIVPFFQARTSDVAAERAMYVR